MLSPVKSVNVRESLELLLTLSYMSDYNKEMNASGSMKRSTY